MEIVTDNVSAKEIEDKVNNKETFKVADLASVKKTAVLIENIIEESGMRCRVITKGRIASALLGGWPIAGMLAHNLATLKPDYVIKKNFINGSVEVIYKK